MPAVERDVRPLRGESHGLDCGLQRDVSRLEAQWDHVRAASRDSTPGTGAIHRLPAARARDMVSHMKTTVDIADPLLLEAKRAAAEDGITLRDLIAEGLRSALERRRRRQPSKLRDASFKGNGVQPGVVEGDWGTLRDWVYEGRGG